MLVRILQSFDKFTLVQEEAAPLGSIPATGWNRGGRKYVEKITPQHSLVVNCKVSCFMISSILWSED